MNPPPFRALHLPEPVLLFGGDFPCVDPKIGLSLYGPHYQHTNRIGLAIIGDSRTVDQVSGLVDICKRGAEGDPNYPLWKQSFPGMSGSGPLRCDLIVNTDWRQTIADSEWAEFEKIARLEDRVRFGVDLFIKKIEKIKGREDQPHVYVCAPPRRMMDLCMPSQAQPFAGGRGRKSDAEKKAMKAAFHPQQHRIWQFTDDFEETEQQLLQRHASDNFHNLLKVRAMKLGVHTQFIRPYTLDKLFGEEEGRVQDRATFCWNLTAALHYKAGGRPWGLRDSGAGTCFAGISFYHEKSGGYLGTSLAQVFTPAGEGIVLQGERFKWEPKKEPHLTKEAAKRLVEKVIAAYKSQTDGVPPARLVIHKTSKFSPEEREGMKEALKALGIPRHDFIAVLVRARRIKFFRSGYHPPLRGTTIVLPDDSRLLYTRGYVPLMDVYPGARVPRPLELRFDETDSSRDDLCREILGLTKLNWNTADFAGNLPITLQFARQVGNILKEFPAGIPPESNYRFYM